MTRSMHSIEDTPSDQDHRRGHLLSEHGVQAAWPSSCMGSADRAGASSTRRLHTSLWTTPLRMLLLLPATLAFASCATYSARTEQAFAEFSQGEFEVAAATYADPEVTGSPFLAGAEAGMAALAGGDWEGAQEHLDAAAAAVKGIEDRGIASPQALGENLLSFTLNESLATYEGEGFERVQLHAALALTYLARGDLDGVWVEARRANELLESEEALYKKKYKAGGLGHFVSALAYELLDRQDEAFIDYERMAEKGVGTELAGRAMVRIANQLHYTDRLPQLAERYGADLERPQEAASIVLIAAVGMGPFKEQTTITIPTGDGLLRWSVPRYVSRDQAGQVVELGITGSTSVRASVIEDIDQVARENLEDRIAWLATRSAVRSVIKRELTQKLESDHGFAGFVIGTVFTIATENADTRAWQTLPHSWQAARLFVEPGQHEVVLKSRGEQRVLGTFELEPGETLIVLARTLAGRLYPHTLGGLRVDAPAPASPDSIEPLIEP